MEMTRIERRVGGPVEGGYHLTMRLKCRDIPNPGDLNDQQLLEAFIRHNARKCSCGKVGS